MAALIFVAAASANASAFETLRAGPPSDVSVTVYRAPQRSENALNLDALEGFALITETRTVTLAQGDTRIRFEGVADGIQPQSAIITGLPRGVVEKNQDAHVLSPSALVDAAVGRQVWLVRTNRKTGKTTTSAGSVAADNEGILFKSSAGIEALRCSGLPETFHFDSHTDLAATPTLSVVAHSSEPVTVQVKLSYLARGFDWMATYSANVAADGKTLDLGAWVTLGNSNGVSFPNAHTQVVAGRLNRQSSEVEPIDYGAEILAQCWPNQTTSDIPLMGPPAASDELDQVMVTGMRRSMGVVVPMALTAAAMAKVSVAEEQLGDLKLYRVPSRTSVASRQVKQVRLLDREAIPVELIYGADVVANRQSGPEPLRKMLRTRNDAAHHLGLPLPSGSVSSFYERSGVPLLVSQVPLRDIAVNEELEIGVGEAPDVQVAATLESRERVPDSVKELPWVPGVAHLRASDMNYVNHLDITNASNSAASIEVRLKLNDDGTNIVKSDHPITMRNGRPTFRVTVPAQGTATLRYQTARTTFTKVRE